MSQKELGENGLSDQNTMSIAGDVSRKMLDHYSHIRLAAKRRAVEALETPLPAAEPEPQTPRTGRGEARYVTKRVTIEPAAESGRL